MNLFLILEIFLIFPLAFDMRVNFAVAIPFFFFFHFTDVDVSLLSQIVVIL